MTVASNTASQLKASDNPRLDEVHRLARRLARVRWPQLDWARLAHSASIRYWETFGGRGGPASSKTWLNRAMVRMIEAVAQLPDSGPAREGNAQHADADHGVDVVLEQLARPKGKRVPDDVMSRALARLKSREFQILRQRMTGHSPIEVALRLRTSPAAVEERYALAKEKIKVTLLKDPQLLADVAWARAAGMAATR